MSYAVRNDCLRTVTLICDDIGALHIGPVARGDLCCLQLLLATPTWGSAERRLARAGTKVSRSLCNMQRQRAPSLTYMLCVAVVQVDGRWWRSAPGGGFWRHFAAGDRRLGGPEMLCGELRSAAQPATAMGRDTESWLGCWWPEASGRRQYMSLRVTLAHWHSDWRLALFGALLCLNPSAAQHVVHGDCSSSSRRVMTSFSLLKVGSWKASYVSLCVWRLKDNALLLLPLRKQHICCPCFNQVDSKLHATLLDVLQTALALAGYGNEEQQSWLSEKGSGKRLAVREIMGVARATYLQRRCSVQLPYAQPHPAVPHP